MAEPNPQKRELTTAELAGYETPAQPSSEPSTDSPGGPRLVKNSPAQSPPVHSDVGLQDVKQHDRVRERIQDDQLQGGPRDASVENPRTPEARAQDANVRSSPMPLFSAFELSEFRAQWIKVQTGFVDEPRRTVQDADKLVANVMQRLAQGFANERSGLEKQWTHGENVSTEDLRLALQRYRSFFDRLLSL